MQRLAVQLEQLEQLNVHVLHNQRLGLDVRRLHLAPLHEVCNLTARLLRKRLLLLLQHTRALNRELQLDLGPRPIPPRHGGGGELSQRRARDA